MKFNYSRERKENYSRRIKRLKSNQKKIEKPHLGIHRKMLIKLNNMQNENQVYIIRNYSTNIIRFAILNGYFVPR